MPLSRRMIVSLTLLSMMIVASSLSWAQNYTSTSTTGEYVPIFGIPISTTQSSGSYSTPEDNGKGTLSLPFAFPFYGRLYNTLEVSVNGYATVKQATSSDSVPSKLPFHSASSSSTDVDGYIAPFFADLFMTGPFDDSTITFTSTITYTITGDPGNRVLTVQWKDMTDYFYSVSSMDYRYNFQMKIYENGGKIVFVYGDNMKLKNSSNPSTSDDGIIGIENEDGSLGTWGLECKWTYVSTYCPNNVCSTTDYDFCIYTHMKKGLTITFTPPEGMDVYGSISTQEVSGPGAAIPVDITLLNGGTQSTGASFDYQLFLTKSKDCSLTDSSNVELATGTAPELDAYEYLLINTTVNIPSSITPDKYYICLNIDTAFAITEIRENNNLFGIPIFLSGPDLEAVSVSSIPLIWTKPYTAPVTVVMRNNGLDALIKYRIYFSADPVINIFTGKDTSVFESSLVSVPSGQEVTFQNDVVVEWNQTKLSNGNYYIGVVIDPSNEVEEYSEQNNITVSSSPSVVAKPAADFATLTIETPIYAAIGENIDINWVVENQGIDVGKAQYEVWLCGISSEYCTAGNGDQLLLKEGELSLAPNEVKHVSASVIVPELIPGEYHVTLIVDPDNIITELNETNNNAHSLFSTQIYESSLRIITDSLPAARLYIPYFAKIDVAGADENYHFEIESNTLPKGLSFDDNTGVISGTATTLGVNTFTVTLLSGDRSVSKEFSLIVTHPTASLQVLTYNVPVAYKGTPYTFDILAVGGVAPYTFALSEGSLPKGLTLSESGRISGTPTVEEDSIFFIKITDQEGVTFPISDSDKDLAKLSMRVVLKGKLSISTLSLQPGMILNKESSITIKASGGSLPYNWKIQEGDLPDGVTFTQSENGEAVISGKPTVVGEFSLIIEVQDADDFVDVNFYVLAVTDEKGLVISTNSLPNGKIDEPYSATLEASGGQDYHWSVILGEVPSGISLDSKTGALSGTPYRAGTFSFAVSVTDTSSRTVAIPKAFAIVIADKEIISKPKVDEGCKCNTTSQSNPLSTSLIMMIGIIMLLARKKIISLTLPLFLVFSVFSTAQAQSVYYCTTGNCSLQPLPNNTYTDITTQGATAVTLIPQDSWSTDDALATIPLGFTYTFFDKTYDKVFISSNGFISFEPITSSYPYNDDIPKSGGPSGYVAGFWDDLDNVNGVSVLTTGDEGSRITTVQYKDMKRDGNTGSALNFQFVVQENLPNKIEVRYGTQSYGTTTSYYRGDGTIGVENPDASFGYAGASCTPNCATTAVPNNLAIVYSLETPDLEVLSLQTSYFGPVGSKIPVAVAIKNNGTKEQRFRYAVFQSSDTYLELDDDLRYTSPDIIIAAGDQKVIQSVVSINPATSEEFYLGVYVDPSDEVKEGNEQNNAKVTSFKLKIPEPQPDLTARIKTFDNQAKSGEKLNITFDLENYGTVSASFGYELFLSRNRAISHTDISLGKFQHSLQGLTNESVQKEVLASVELNIFSEAVIKNENSSSQDDSLSPAEYLKQKDSQQIFDYAYSSDESRSFYDSNNERDVEIKEEVSDEIKAQKIANNWNVQSSAKGDPSIAKKTAQELYKIVNFTMNTILYDLAEA